MPHVSPLLNRREFLKISGLGALALAGALPASTQAAARTLPAPPVIMLHSRHRWLLPTLLEALLEEEYTGISLADLSAALAGDRSLPPQPVMITIDDLDLVRGTPSYEAFDAMHMSLVEYGFPGVFGIITHPDDPPSEAWWQAIAGWVDEGIEFATHTAYHSNLDDPAFTAEDFREEIVESARSIQRATGQPVRALVTPYGSGYDRQTGSIRPEIVTACQDARIQFVIGITGGRQPIPLEPDPDEVIYLGRMPAGIDDTLESTLFELHHWG